MNSTMVGRRAVLGAGLLAGSIPFRARAQKADSIRVGVLAFLPINPDCDRAA
jgi:hypothetical protein